MASTPVTLRRISPMSTLRMATLVNVVLFLIWMVAVALLYLALGGMGVWDSVNGLVGDVNTASIGAGTVFLLAALVGLVNVVVLTLLATVGALVYNACAGLVGGVELSLGASPTAEPADKNEWAVAK